MMHYKWCVVVNYPHDDCLFSQHQKKKKKEKEKGKKNSKINKKMMAILVITLITI
jgi:hypothetical protein